MILASASPAAAQPAPVPPPLEQAGADCDRPQYASDKLVCSNGTLRRQDADVAALARSLPHLAPGALWEDQYAWFRRRSLCAFANDHQGCLSAAYADRRLVLVAAAMPTVVALRCKGPWRGRNLASSRIALGEALTITENGRLVAVATPVRTAWQPWLGWRMEGRNIRVQPQSEPAGAKPFLCRPVPGTS